jgi:mannose-6-phosphate isomerase
MLSVEIAHTLAPFRIAPRFVSRVWGLKDLHPWYDCVAEGDPIGEVWLTGDDCLVETGPHAGNKLSTLFAEAHELLLGAGADSPESPLLIKVIFAREKLSVQVHPDDELAHKYGQPRGKTECWYALAAEPGAQVACGLKAGVTLEKIEEGIRAGTLEESLQMIDVAAGEMIYVDAGTVHAIWPGSILLETQQNCDLTYRMYDYGRPRELHVQKALESVKFESDAGVVPAKTLTDRTVLIDTQYFRMERLKMETRRPGQSLPGLGESAPGLAYLFAASGKGLVTGPSFEPVELPARGIVAIPVSAPEFAVEDRGGLELIRIAANRTSQLR